jgi:hypothetical protein
MEYEHNVLNKFARFIRMRWHQKLFQTTQKIEDLLKLGQQTKVDSNRGRTKELRL